MARDGATAGRASEPVDAWDLRIAPDGRRVAITEVDPQLRTLDVFIRDGSQPVPTRLSLSTDVDESGVWSPDGLRIAWAGRRRHVMIRGAGAVLPEQTIASFDSPVQVWDWSRDGRSLLIGRTQPTRGDDLWIQPPTEGAAAQPYVTTAFNQTFGAFSPDGRWVPTRRMSRGSSISTSIRFRSRARACASPRRAAPSRDGAPTAASCSSGAARRFTAVAIRADSRSTR